MLTPTEKARIEQLKEEIETIERTARTRHANEANDCRYSFSDIKNPEYLDDTIRFQNIFSRFISVLIDDEDAVIRLHERMLGSLYGNPLQTANKSTFDSDRKRFRKAIQILADSSLVWDSNAMMSVAYFGGLNNGDDISKCAREIYDAVLSIKDARDNHETLPSVLDRLEKWLSEASESLPDRRNINWEGVHAVDCLRRFWENWGGRPAPRRALNPASPFADYLREAFDFFDIAADPIAAFKRLAALQDAEPERWK